MSSSDPDPRPRPGPTQRPPRPAPRAQHPAPTPTFARPASVPARPRITGRVAQRTGIVAVAAAIAVGAAAATAASPVTTAARNHVARTSARVPGLSAATQSLVPGTGQQALHGAAKNTPEAASVDHGVISALAANGIPAVALNAYRVAAARMNDVDPGCGVPWYLLAGIGREESDHGRFHGSVLHADGVSTPAIIGPALDGIRWDYIPAPADGLALDGDAKFAHALGPMQFIPQTWAGYGADATNDGKADIFNINDAALGAARYLCAAGGDLHDLAGKTRAVSAYNHNDTYIAQVIALSQAYHKGISISGLPVGITKGSLPRVKAGKVPPAHPSDARTSGGAAGSSTRPTKTAPSTKSAGSSSKSATPTRTGKPTTTPSPSPTASCSDVDRGLDNLKPKNERTCAPLPSVTPSR